MSVVESLYPVNYKDKMDAFNDQVRQDGSVAIVMRTKDRHLFLARAFQSVINQTYKNWHLYVVNTGADTQAIHEMAQDYGTLLTNQLTILEYHGQGGIEAASNLALKDADENFFVIHDDDDTWHPGFLEQMVPFLQKNPEAVAALSNCYIVNEAVVDGCIVEKSTTNWDGWALEVDILNLIKKDIMFSICLLVRMQAFKALGGAYNEQLPVLGDWEFCLRLFTLGDFVSLNKRLAYSHQRSTHNEYGNQIFRHGDDYEYYTVELRNALVRDALISDPGNYGFLHAVLTDAENNKNKMIEDMKKLYKRINNLEDRLSKLIDKMIAQQNK